MNKNLTHLAYGCSMLALAGCGQKEKKQEDKKPNIILIMADDMGYECLGCYGSAAYSTPNLDQMAAEGVRFEHCYSQPLCTPSRVKIMTGKYNYRNYIAFGYLDRNERTFGNMMKDAGYKTCLAGKWQLNGLYHKDKFPDWHDTKTPYHFGFDTYCLWQLNKGRGEGERFGNPLLTQNEKLLDSTINDQYAPDIFCEFICDFMEKHHKNPFFVYYPMVLVHEPFVPTPDSKEWKNPDLWYKKDTSFYADMMAYTDKIVGNIENKTEELGIAENTIIIFTGDNGTHPTIYSKMKDGTVIQGGKGKMTNYGTRVPLIAYWKNHTKGIVSDNLIDFNDFYPTLADAAGIKMQEDKICDGKSFLNILLQKKYHPRENMFMHYNPKWYNQPKGQFARNKTYKLYRDGDFFNVNNDPLEKDTLVTDELSREEKNIKQSLYKVFEGKPKIDE